MKHHYCLNSSGIHLVIKNVLCLFLFFKLNFLEKKAMVEFKERGDQTSQNSELEDFLFLLM